MARDWAKEYLEEYSLFLRQKKREIAAGYYNIEDRMVKLTKRACHSLRKRIKSSKKV